MTEATSLAQALVNFQAEAPAFKKDKTANVPLKDGRKFSYKYADLGDILHVVQPLLSKHGLSWSSKPSSDAQGELVLRYRLLHVSGEIDEGEMPLSVSRGCKPQELGSAITYARRYAITAQLNLATEEDDDGQTAQNAEPSRRQVRAKIEEQFPPQPTLDDASLKALRRVYAETAWTEDQLRLQLTAVGVQDVSDIKRAMTHLSDEQANGLLSAMEAALEQAAV